jgi:TIR domain
LTIVKLTVRKEIKNSQAVLILLTQDFENQSGLFQRQVRDAVDTAENFPENQIFVIPLRLEKCDIPEKLSSYKPLDLFAPNGYGMLIKTLNAL